MLQVAARLASVALWSSFCGLMALAIGRAPGIPLSRRQAAVILLGAIWGLTAVAILAAGDWTR